MIIEKKTNMLTENDIGRTEMLFANQSLGLTKTKQNNFSETEMSKSKVFLRTAIYDWMIEVKFSPAYQSDREATYNQSYFWLGSW